MERTGRETSEVANDEMKSISFGEFQHVIEQTGVIQVLKFWSLVMSCVREVYGDREPSGASVIACAGMLARHIMTNAPDQADIIERIRQADIDTGQKTDLSFLDSFSFPGARAPQSPEASTESKEKTSGIN